MSGRNSLVLFAALFACNGSSEPTIGPDINDVADWSEVQSARNDVLATYLDNESQGLEWFEGETVGNSGIPMIMFKVLPDIFPDIWGPGYAEEIGFPPATDSNDGLPGTVAYGMGSTPLIDFPGLRNVRMQVVNLTCASCHNGRVTLEDGSEQALVGAPSLTMDVNLWRYKLWQSAVDPRWTFDNFQAAIESKSSGWLYDDTLMYFQEVLDETVFEEKGELILEAVREKLVVKEDRIHGYIGDNSYGDLEYLLDGGTPGQLEPFGIATAKFIPDDLAEWTEEDRQAFLADTIPPGPAVIDIMSVWRQADRDAAQWDGNISSPLIRNLAAEVGVIGDAELVNFENAQITTDFVRWLPAPVYPFAVDVALAQEGRAIYDNACASCHDAGGTFVPLDDIGTDEGRALGLPEAARVLLAQQFQDACIDSSEPDCNLEVDEIIEPRTTNPGYFAGPLDGVWSRAPYLHNGSVPTLEHLLVPSSRPDTFYRGATTYDQDKVGFDWTASSGGTEYTTDRMGFSNAGHDDINLHFGGYDFSTDDASREALIEYLKTL